jgi:hypothetical protein
MTFVVLDIPNSDGPVVVRIEDLRAARLCFEGTRPWFRRHGFDWQAFLAEGISSDRLAATGDALAHRVIAKARERIARESADNQTGEDPSDGR